MRHRQAARRLQDEVDPAFALLYEHVSAPDPSVRLHAIMGLAIAYAGTQKEQVSDRSSDPSHTTPAFAASVPQTLMFHRNDTTF